MPTVKFEELYKADIIFTTSHNSTVSKTIRAATNSIISHSILVTSQIKVIDSTADGVLERDWMTASAGATLAIVMRRGGLLNGPDQDKVITAARSFEKRPYDYIGAAGAGMGDTRNKIIAGAGCTILPIGCAVTAYKMKDNAKPENADNAFFCSELISRSFAIAGFQLLPGAATYHNPQMVYISPSLNYVGHLIGE